MANIDEDNTDGIDYLLMCGNDLLPDVDAPASTVDLGYDPMREHELEDDYEDTETLANADTTTDAPNMDVDLGFDLTDRNEERAPSVATEDMRTGLPQKIVEMEELLMRTRTEGDHWTHIQFWPLTARHRIVDEADAVQLYRTWSSGGLRRQICLMERRICELTRASFFLRWTGDHRPADDTEIFLTVHHLQCFMKNHLGRQNTKEVGLHAFILLSSECPSAVVVHFPSVTISTEDINRTFCRQALTFIQREHPSAAPPLHHIVCRNRRSCYPMYGGSVPSSSPVVGAYSVDAEEEGETGQWTAKWWMSHPKSKEPRSPGRSVSSFPLDQIPLPTSCRAEWGLQACLPMLLSINPMGVPLLRPRETPDQLPSSSSSDGDRDTTRERERLTIAHILRFPPLARLGVRWECNRNSCGTVDASDRRIRTTSAWPSTRPVRASSGGFRNGSSGSHGACPDHHSNNGRCGWSY